MPELTQEERRQLASTKLDRFFAIFPAELRTELETLPRHIAVMNTKSTIKLQEVLHMADKVSNHASPFIACARGCSHCCHVSVPISEYEARYIGENLGLKPASLKRSIRRNISEFSDKTPCPFLVDGECSVYAYRPLTCRMHVSFDIDNYWCRYENWDKPDAAVPRPTISPLLTAYHQLAGKTEPIVADIRDFFPHGSSL